LQKSLKGDMVAVRTTNLRAALDALKNIAGVRRAALFGDTIHVLLDSKARDWAAVQAALVSANVELTEAHDVAASLEDVFIERVTSADAAAE
jgi:hypothetical protein